ncbi:MULTISPECIES: protein translocase subunit SecDF [unclassified Lentilitoribacter]|jgi:SecD/SecF fusion protein|uniref:protein translocase subunit SecDF n=1 Tax=unclassified Lentilitoribacter TaxID=2647570 RepID=UPI0013A6B899|nr:protein translocase subunit SecDF [Lentilitoribacter sp. Alg239-R112]
MLYFARWKTTLIWLAVFMSAVVALPNLLSENTLKNFPDFMPKGQVTLGLDLQGGSHMLLRLERNEIIEERIQTTRDDVRRLLRAEGIGYTGLSAAGQAVQVRIRNNDEIEQAKDILDELLVPVDGGLLGGGTIVEITREEPQEGLLRFSLSEAGIDYRVSAAVAQSIEVVRRRVDELGTTEPTIQRQGSDRLLVQVPGLEDPQQLKEILKTTAKLTFRMVDTSMPVQEAINGRPPATSEILPASNEAEGSYLIQRSVLVAGENLVDAQAGFDQQTNEPIVTFRFDTKGAQRFGQATQQNVGLPFAIVLDDQVISAPRINEPILGGSGQISGNFTVEEANNLAILLRAGALPATLTIIEERTVGPSLGADSIAAGKVAGIIGAVLVVVFMILAYGVLGIVANIALIANIVMIMAILTLFGATLTLPGIAGIVLTVGMAVDSNVLIYERIREEARAGRNLVQAIEAGFARALTTILDANITTLIAAAILFFVGTGPVKGFAVTLTIGIITTVFSAFTLTRWMMAFWFKRRRPKALPDGLMGMLPSEFNFKFMKLRNAAFIASVFAAVASVALFFTIDMNYGIDFKGGSIIEVRSQDGPADLGDLRTRMSELNLGDVQVQEFGSPEEVLIRVQAQDGSESSEQNVVTLVRAELDSEYEFRRVEVVGPTVSSELATAGALAVGGALFAILIYIWLRFEWQFAIGAVVATFHDVLLTIGIFVLSGVEFNLSSVAAVLTIVGYSLNDTVVVYDRVRENLRRYKKKPLDALLDLSVNQMLSRTMLTSVTTLLALLALFLFGGEVIQSFTFAMIFGVIVGTYSSTFIAAPILILFKLRPEDFRKGLDDKVKKKDETEGTLPVQFDT